MIENAPCIYHTAYATCQTPLMHRKARASRLYLHRESVAIPPKYQCEMKCSHGRSTSPTQRLHELKMPVRVPFFVSPLLQDRYRRRGTIPPNTNASTTPVPAPRLLPCSSSFDTPSYYYPSYRQDQPPGASRDVRASELVHSYVDETPAFCELGAVTCVRKP